MTLKECLGIVDGTVFLGSKSAFFFIGTKEEFLLIESTLTKKLKRNLTDLIASYKRQYEHALAQGFDGELEKKRLDEAKRQKRTFVPLSERKVTDYYPRFQGDGTVVLVDGDEVGRYWRKDEFEQEIKRARRRMKNDI